MTFKGSGVGFGLGIWLQVPKFPEWFRPRLEPGAHFQVEDSEFKLQGLF